VLLGLVAGSGFLGVYWPESVAGVLVVVGLIVGAAGLALLLIAGVSLGPAFSPLPRPSERGRLNVHGVYRRVRHPIYGGVLLIALGWSLAESPLGLIPTAALVVVLDLKARVEEDWLEQRYPEYGPYRKRTPRRFVPWVF
jgi:protein-S-isoprenylcysteine O-methyltransferase Ste14